MTRLALRAVVGCLVACGFALALTAAPTPRPPLPFVEVRPAISGDGRIVAFERCRGGGWVRRGEAGDVTDIVRVEVEGGASAVVTAGANGASMSPSLDERGEVLAFASEASNLVPRDGDACRGVFVWSGGVVRALPPPHVAAGRSGSAEPCVGGGRVAFVTYGVAGGVRAPVQCGLEGGGWLTAAGDVLCYGRPALADGGFVFSGSVRGGAASLYDASLHPQVGGVPAYEPAWSRAAIAFSSPAALAGDDTNGTWDVYVKAQRLERVSVTSEGAQSADASAEPCISGDGRFVAFTSYGLSAAGSNVYLRDRRQGTTRLLSHRPDGRAGCGPSFHPAISADGRRVVFASRAADLDPGRRACVYLWDADRDTVRGLP